MHSTHTTTESFAGADSPLLSVRDLAVHFDTAQGELTAVRQFSLDAYPGECIGIVGESGAGKSQALLAVMHLLAANGRVTGSARFQDVDLLGARPGELTRIRGARVAMIFQDPMTSLTPHMKVGDQLAESLVIHRAMSWTAARSRAVQLLQRVHITDAARRSRQYPHELSGGMRQRVMIAMALACDPELLIADEPTTALDVTIQAQILSLLAELKRERMTLILVTHDLGVVAGIADRVIVMYAGRIVEQGPVRAVMKTPRHPYTKALLRSMPRVDASDGGSLASIQGQPPSIRQQLPGCAFHPRCERAAPECRTTRPELAHVGESLVACLHPERTDTT